MTIKIDQSVPLPDDTGGRRRKYPFADMGVGDSFFAPDRTSTNLNSAARRHRDKTFTARSVTEAGVKGARVWRVK